MRRIREESVEEGRRIGPASVFAMAAMTVITIAVIYNALFASRTAGFAGKSSLGGIQFEVKAGGAAGKTIRLKYDPVVEEIQRQLLSSGYYRGAVDGVVGKKTQQAIEAYQRAVGLELTGEPSAALAEHIRYTRQISEASLFTGSVEADPDAVERAQVRRVQTGLAELAYSPGEISGEMTVETMASIRRFQSDRGLEETGEISAELLRELSKLSGQSELNAD